MKNQKGSAGIIALAIAILVIGGGVYVYLQRNADSTTAQTGTPKPVAPAQNVPAETNSTDKATSVYTNTKFGFKFNHPTSWKMTGEIGKNNSGYRPPYLFDEVLTTENHPINKAGHVSVFSMSLDKFMEEIQKTGSAIKVEGLTDVKTVNLTGKKFKLVHQQVQGSNSQQTDFVWALSLGDKTLYINFMSMNTPEKQISKELELQIDQVVKTVSTI